MSKAKLLGMYKPYVPNSRADRRRKPFGRKGKQRNKRSS